MRETSKDVQIDSIIISQDNENWQTESAKTSGGKGPYGLNDEAGRELIESARSGITITPDNFLEYAKIRNLRKGLNVRPPQTFLDKYPFLTGVNQFQSGIGKKLTSDFQDCYDNVCRIIDLPKNKNKSLDDESNDFTTAVAGYLNGKRAIRTWRTLWLVKEPAATKDKIILVRLLRRLHNYHIDREDAGYEHMRKSLKSIMDIIPDELKFPTNRNN